MHQSNIKPAKKDYIIPIFEEKDLMHTKVQHRLNLFGQKGLFTFQDRILYILKINNLVFQEENSYLTEIQDLLQNPLSGLKNNKILEIAPETYYEKFFDKYMLKKDLTQHHIIFKNPQLGGHIRYKDNLIWIERGKHTSFHQLLDHANFYPHQQLSQFLSLEKSTLPQSFLSSLEMIEKSTEKQFQKNPFSIYKEDVFQKKFRRLNF